MFAGVASISLGLPVPGVTGSCVVLQCYCPTVYELTSTTLCTVCILYVLCVLCMCVLCVLCALCVLYVLRV